VTIRKCSAKTLATNRIGMDQTTERLSIPYLFRSL
jgi:hypothetical protein